MYFSSPGPAGPCRLDNSVSFKERERRILGSSTETKKIVDVGKQLKCQVFYHNQLYRIKKNTSNLKCSEHIFGAQYAFSANRTTVERAVNCRNHTCAKSYTSYKYTILHRYDLVSNKCQISSFDLYFV